MTKQEYLKYAKQHNLTWCKGKLVDINTISNGCTHTPIRDNFTYYELKNMFDEYFSRHESKILVD